MSTSAKIRWIILAIAVVAGASSLFLSPTNGRFYCGCFIIAALLFLFFVSENTIDSLLYGEKIGKVLKEGTAVYKESQLIFKRSAKSGPSPLRTQLESLQNELKAALLARDAVAISKQSTELEKLLDKHFSTYKKAAWREVFDPIAIAVLIALLLRSFVLEAFEIPSGSMIPNLLVGDKIFVNKMVYNIRVPFFNQQICRLGEPKRGDVAVFVYPLNPSDNFIKRVVGLPGDQVEVKENFVYINGKALPRRNMGSSSYWDLRAPESWYQSAYNIFEERNGDKSYTVIQDPLRIRADFPRMTIPPNHIFVMGDNRDNSSDSREWGLVPMENLVGRAMFIWWSKGPSLHKERFFTWVD